MIVKDNGYEVLAPIYDEMNGEVDYSAWADFIEAIFDKHGEKKIESVVDLGCGTGTMTIELARRGYDMTAVDGSADMLSVARSRDTTGGGILWLMQELQSFELYGTVDAAVSCLDCVNHLTKRADVKSFFHWVHNYLEPGGLFLFDVNTPAKFERVYGDNAYIMETDTAYLGWQNSYTKSSGLCTFYLDVFRERDDGLYERTSGIQKERCYTKRTLDAMLKDAGFDLCAVYADYSFSAPDENTERWYYVCRAVK